jgi:PhnB protein
MELTPYIIFNDNCEEALNFYAVAMDGQIKNMMRFGDMPPGEGGNPLSDADKSKVMHSHFEAEGIRFMASDSGMGVGTSYGSGQVHLSINFEDERKMEKMFNALSEGGKVTMPLQDTFWGARFGMLTDKYGMNWMFNHDKQQQ